MFDGGINLQSLDLGDNGLTGLPSGVFDVLTNLQGLDLGGNDLTELPSGVFDGGINLQGLYLGDNPGSHFAIIHPNADLDCGVCRVVQP